MPVPSPQAALTIGPIAIAAGAQPPAIGCPLSGATTNQATNVGATAPKRAAATIRRAPSSRANATASTMPQTPPQKASDHNCAMPNGGVGENEYAARGVS